MSIISCPKCGSTNIYYDARMNTYECFNCRNKWSREEEKKRFREETEGNLERLLKGDEVEEEECYGKKIYILSIKEWIIVLTNREIYQRLYGAGKDPTDWEIMSLNVFQRGIAENILSGDETYCEGLRKLVSEGRLRRWLREW